VKNLVSLQGFLYTIFRCYAPISHPEWWWWGCL